MRLKITYKKDKARIKELVEFACQTLDMRRIELHVKNSRRAYRGRGGYTNNGITKMAKTSTWMATVCIGNDSNFPIKVRYDQTLRDWQDCLVWLTAHEAHHCIQAKERAKMNEKGPCRFAAWRLKEFQKLNKKEAL